MKSLSGMFDKGVKCSTKNSEKCVVTTVLLIPSYPSINNHPLLMEYIRPPKQKLSKVWDMDI